MLRPLRRAAALALAAVLHAAPAPAEMYSDDALLAEYQRVGDSIALMVTEDIPATLPPAERARAAAIRVVFEPRAAHPLYFYARPDEGTVHVPVASVRFLADLAILTAWFERRGCAPQYLHTYLWALLREGRPLPSPLEAFAVARETALADPFVDDVAAKALSTGLLFVLAHEVGHVMLGHRPGLAGARSQAQEIAADAFALDRFAALGAPPAGAVLWFMAARWIDPTAEHAAGATHPVSPERLRAVADRLAADPDAFAFSQPDPEAARAAALTYAAEFRRIADLMADDAMLTLLPAGLDRDFPLAALRTACPG